MENRVYGLVILEVVQVLVERSKVSSLESSRGSELSKGKGQNSKSTSNKET